MEQPLGNPKELWKSPRGTVIRIEVFALLAIALSIFLVAFGSSRRWSNHWIIQKGVLVTNALSLSLGTYSIGLMQSSPVKSEMYPIWAASLLTLFGSIDSTIGYNLDYSSQFFKLLYQLCLYCGYVLLIGISTISSDVGNIAIGVLCAITFIKGFHRSLACVLPSRLRNANKFLMRDFYLDYVVDWPLDEVELDHFMKRNTSEGNEVITMDKIWRCALGSPGSNASSYKDVCLSFSLCHLLQRRSFGFSCAEPDFATSQDFVRGLLVQRDGAIVDCERAFKVTEVELAFLYDIFFTNNAFLHYYESKAATIWTFASIAAIIFVGVVTAIPGTRRTHISRDMVVVTTTQYDIAITLVILVSIALLQVMQLIHCWTSNWARVALVCQSIRNGSESCQMRLKAFLCRINWFNGYVWQRKLGQYSFVESISTRDCKLFKHATRPFIAWSNFARILGLQYVEQVFVEMFGSPSGLNHVVLTTDVKKAIIDSYIRIHVHEDLVSWTNWQGVDVFPDGLTGLRTILTWHIATCYLAMKQIKDKNWLDKQHVGEEREQLLVYFDVATTLSKYYAYLIVSLPQLLPHNPLETKSVYNAVAREARLLLRGRKDKYEAMKQWDFGVTEGEEGVFHTGTYLGQMLEDQPVFLLWKELAGFWANRLIYAARSDNIKEHIDRLARGGEFITHLWALQFSAGDKAQQRSEMSAPMDCY